MSSSHRECGADAAAYALGALEPSEAEAFRRHLATCAICQDEVASFRGIADALPLAAAQLRPPPGLRRRVMRAVRAEPRPARGAPAVARRRLPPALARTVLASGLAVIVALAAFGAVKLLSGGSGTKVIQASVAGSSGRAELHVASGHGELILSDFPPPPAGHVYEVWLKRSARAPSPTSALFSVTSAGSGDVVVPGNLRGVDEVLVTPEPDGGSRAPTHAPVIVAQLS